MLTARIVIETLPGRAREVEDRLAVVPEVRVHGRDDAHLSGVCAVPPSETLAGFLDQIASVCPCIVSVQSTFVREH